MQIHVPQEPMEIRVVVELCRIVSHVDKGPIIRIQAQPIVYNVQRGPIMIRQAGPHWHHVKHAHKEQRPRDQVQRC